MPQSNESNSDLILKWLSRLSRHFGTELSEDQLEIFYTALKSSSAYQLNEAFNRCLNECEFMPKLAQVHDRMPEQRYQEENPGRFVLNGPPTLDLIRPIAREICLEFDSLDVMIPKQAEQVREAMGQAIKIYHARLRG